MKGQGDHSGNTGPSGPPPSVAISFVMGCLGAFHSLIVLVDPLL